MRLNIMMVPGRGSVTRARPRHPLYRMPFESWREACFAFPGTKKEWPACASHVLYWCPEEDSVTQARPRHPLHRMSFESWREACFAFPGTKRKWPACASHVLYWCPEEDSNLHTLRHTDLNRARLPIPPSGPRLVEGAQ